MGLRTESETDKRIQKKKIKRGQLKYIFGRKWRN